MLKKLIALGLLAVLLAAPLSCLGETFRIEQLMAYQSGISAVSGQPYVLITDKRGTQKAVFSTDGTQLTDYLHNAIGFLAYDYFTVCDETGINNRALMYISGAEIIPPEYGAFKAVDKHWVLGYVLNEDAESAYTYTRSKTVYGIERLDLFFVTDPAEGARLVASLAPEAYSSAASHGAYIAIQDRNDAITLYDQSFQAYDYPMAKVSTPVYGVEAYEVINKATGEAMMEGYVSVKELMMNGEMALIVGRYNFKGEMVYTVIDLDGKEIMPMDFSIESVSGDYAIVTQNKLKGLYSISRQELIVPCEYNNIMASSVSVDKYVFNGYVAVEKGNQRGYFDTRTGTLSCDIKYNRKSVTTIGCSTYWKNEDGTYTLAAADGVETVVAVNSIYAKTRGDGHLLVASKDGFYGVIDWHGNEILPFEHKNLITITDDAKALIRSSTGYELDAIVIEE